MDKKYVITITRQFGSLGRPIARELSELLQIEYYDRDIVDATSKNLGLPVSVVSDTEDKKISYFNMSYPLGRGSVDVQKQVFREQCKIIHNLADKESCIIVGRCSDYVLADYENCLHVYIYAPYKARYKNCVEVLQMKPENAKKTIVEVDKARISYHKHYAGYLPGEHDHYHLMLNSGFLGVKGTARIIAQMVREWHGCKYEI